MEIIVEFPSGKKRAFNSGVKAELILADSEFNPIKDSIIAARVNNEIVSVSYKLEVSCTLFPILLDSREGVNIYRRSLCYLLAKACKKLFKHRRLVIGHSLGKGYYYYFDGMDAVPGADLNKLTELMLEIVKQDLPENEEKTLKDEGIKFFKFPILKEIDDKKN